MVSVLYGVYGVYGVYARTPLARKKTDEWFRPDIEASIYYLVNVKLIFTLREAGELRGVHPYTPYTP